MPYDRKPQHSKLSAMDHNSFNCEGNDADRTFSSPQSVGIGASADPAVAGDESRRQHAESSQWVSRGRSQICYNYNCPSAAHAEATRRLDDTCIYCNHGCRKLTKREFAVLTRSLPVVESFQKRWGIGATYMDHICGINMGESYCQLSGPCTTNCCCSALDSRESTSVCQYLIPAGMPYFSLTSYVFGEIFCTPFYCVIPRLVQSLPDAAFSLRKLNLSRVISNYIFRHELAFKQNLQIEPPQMKTDASSFSEVIRSYNTGSTDVSDSHSGADYGVDMWLALRYEIRDIRSNAVTRPPIPLLPQVINGIKHLMLTVLPASYCSRISLSLDAAKFIEEDSCVRRRYFEEFIEFMKAALNVCVFPVRKYWIKKMSAQLARGLEDEAELAAGLETATALLNLTKIDQINARVRERIPSLLENTGKIEVLFYQEQVQAGKIKASEFLSWLESKPAISEIRRSSDEITCLTPPSPDASGTSSIIVNEPSAKALQLLSSIIAAFLWSYMRTASREPVSPVFHIDTNRIKSLQRKFDQYVLDRLEKQLQVSCLLTSHKVHRLLSSPNIRERKVYGVIESRALAAIASHVYTQLLRIVAGTAETADRKLSIKGSTLSSITDEITLLLALHWTGASRYYLEYSMQSEPLH